MKIPFPMFTIVLLFWGWQTNQWQAAAVMALLVEARYLTTWRWQAEDKDFYRLSDLATLLLVGLLLYPHITGSRQIPSVTYELQVLPYALLPILLGQLYSTRQTIPLAALFYTLRHSTIKKPDISVDYLFIGGCLTSASASPLPNPWYAPGVALLVLFFLWQHRPHRYPRFYWLLIVLASTGFAYMQQHGMVILQQQVGEKAVQWLHKWWGPPQDPFHRTTALGDVGPLKMSSSILFRVDQPHPWTMPLLLRESSYNTFLGKTWLGSHNQLQEIPLSTQVGWWPLHGDQPQGEAITVYRSFGKGSSMIATPQGTTLLAGLPAMAMEANAFGAIKIKDPPPFARFNVYYNSQQTHDRPPDETDLSIPVKEQAAIAQTAHQLGLTGLPPHTVIQRISDYFNQHFRYTVLLDGSASGESPISRFLLTGRAGHCEYFATSTVLLLRQAGIPTRYVFGYSVHEPEGKVRVVRQRHAHAWASAYVEGRWLDVDTTPPDWQESEAQAVSLWS
ncbi:MAG: transglutaminase domain-containing protein, partial [Magnetococcales bacterium]|nr:transglutaminase domain-containing protein [Magnetococcales bacterium]